MTRLTSNKRKKKLIKPNQETEFSTGNIPDLRLDVKKSLPAASRFTEPDQNKKVKQGGQLY